MNIVYSLFLFISAFVFVYCICPYVFSSFDATILVNKDAYIKQFFRMHPYVALRRQDECDPDLSLTYIGHLETDHVTVRSHDSFYFSDDLWSVTKCI